jgi:hypothetical protein
MSIQLASFASTLNYILEGSSTMSNNCLSTFFSKPSTTASIFSICSFKNIKESRFPNLKSDILGFFYCKINLHLS